MNRLEEIKNEYALFNNYPNWDEFISDTPIYRREEHYDEIGKIYAEKCVKASLEKASENIKMIDDIDTPHWVDKQSITNPENIILL